MPESWVINASPVILLAKVGLIRNVAAMLDTLVIPQPVVTEILKYHNRDAAAVWLEGEGRQFVRPLTAESKQLLSSGIGMGERAVISFASVNSGFAAVLDDLEARAIAHSLGIRTLGTIGVVLRLKKAGAIPEAKSYLQDLRKVGGYMSNDLFREALRQAGENL